MTSALAAACVSFLALCLFVGQRAGGRLGLFIGGTIGVVGLGLPIATLWMTHHADSEEMQPSQAAYTTSAQCVRCHPDHVESWQRTYHSTMSRLPSAESVLGDFSGRSFDLKGFEVRPYREDDRFLVDLPAPPVPGQAEALHAPDRGRRIFPVDLVVGSHVTQAYFTKHRDGRLMKLPLVWSIADESWLPETGSAFRPPSPRLYDEFTVSWNQGCIFCHSTKPNPGLEITEDGRGILGWELEVAEYGIACEACHGPGELHVQANTNPARRFAQRSRAPSESDASIVNPAQLPQQQSLEVCGRCHGKWAPKQEFSLAFMREGDAFRPGGPTLAAHYVNPRPDEQHDGRDGRYFWPDWTPLATAMEYQGVVQSPCIEDPAFTCLSCHSLHDAHPDDQLRFPEDPETGHRESNAMCTSCHPELAGEGATAHSNHTAESPGNQCVNCHMPFLTFGLLKSVRTHRIHSPNAMESAEHSVPNACNQCHVDQSLGWTAEKLHAWYGQPAPELEAEDAVWSATVLDGLRGNALQRGQAAARLGWEDAKRAAPGPWRVPLLLELMDDPYDVVRFVARRSLEAVLDQEVDYDDQAGPARRALQLATLQQEWERKGSLASALAPSAPPLGHPSDHEVEQEIEQQIESLKASRDNIDVWVLE